MNRATTSENDKQGKAGDFKEYILNQKDKIEPVLPKGIDADEYLAKLTQILATDQNFAGGAFNSKSFIDALIKCALGGLYPNTAKNEAYLTVGRDGYVKYLIGLGGVMKWATKAGLQIRAGKICKNDMARLERRIDGVDFYVQEAIAERGQTVAYYASYINRRHPEDRDAIIISKEDIKVHQKLKAGNSTTWNTCFDSMAKNFCIKQLLRHYQYDLYDDSTEVNLRAEAVLNSDDLPHLEKDKAETDAVIEEAEPSVNDELEVNDTGVKEAKQKQGRSK